MITVETARPRTTLPIDIRVDSPRAGKLLVIERSTAGSKTIELPLTTENQSRHARFWTEREGTYDVVFVSGEVRESAPLVITRQIYMPFSQEFGLFFLLWIGVMVAIFFTVRRTRCIDLKKYR